MPRCRRQGGAGGRPRAVAAIEAGAAFRSIAERHGAAEITEVRRQREDWQKDATRALATGRTAEAIHAYARDMVHAADTREQRAPSWRAGIAGRPIPTRPASSSPTNAEVRELNQEARERVRASGGLGEDVGVTVDRGARLRGRRPHHVPAQRALAWREERHAGHAGADRRRHMAVRLDGAVALRSTSRTMPPVDHGYAAPSTSRRA
jgi:ATP-dependent exoDNAse (exonuclease V) alpha subunit